MKLEKKNAVIYGAGVPSEAALQKHLQGKERKSSSPGGTWLQ
jgi:hypothetical protein